MEESAREAASRIQPTNLAGPNGRASRMMMGIVTAMRMSNPSQKERARRFFHAGLRARDQGWEQQPPGSEHARKGNADDEQNEEDGGNIGHGNILSFCFVIWNTGKEGEKLQMLTTKGTKYTKV